MPALGMQSQMVPNNYPPQGNQGSVGPYAMPPWVVTAQQPSAGGYPMQVQAPQKKTNTAVVILAVFAGVVILCGAVGLIMYFKKKECGKGGKGKDGLDNYSINKVRGRRTSEVPANNNPERPSARWKDPEAEQIPQERGPMRRMTPHDAARTHYIDGTHRESMMRHESTDTRLEPDPVALPPSSAVQTGSMPVAQPDGSFKIPPGPIPLPAIDEPTGK